MRMRPYIQLSIQVLEELAARKAGNATTLCRILEELGHRKTNKAGEFRSRIEQRIAELGAATRKPGHDAPNAASRTGRHPTPPQAQETRAR